MVRHPPKERRPITPPPHLVFLYPQLKKLTGAQRLILMLAKWTVLAGARVTIITHRITPEVRAALDSAVALIETEEPVDRFDHHYLDAALEYLAAPALLDYIPPDAAGIVCFGPPTLPALRLARRRWGHRLPLLYFCYEPPRAAYSDRHLIARRFGPLAPLVALAARLYRPLDRHFAHTADAILANGVYGQALIRAAYNVEATILPHGVDLVTPTPEQIAATRARWNLTDGATVALTVNQLHPRKRVELTIQAVARARAAGYDIRALIVGTGVERAALEAARDRFGLGETVTFYGFVPDDELPALYAAADLYIHTTRAETFGLSLLEGAASGLPSVAVAEGGPLEILRDGDTGLLVPPTAAALAEGIITLAADPAAARAMGARARADVLARYQWRIGAERLLSVYERVGSRQ